jgi:hypothetical protein
MVNNTNGGGRQYFEVNLHFDSLGMPLGFDPQRAAHILPFGADLMVRGTAGEPLSELDVPRSGTSYPISTTEKTEGATSPPSRGAPPDEIHDTASDMKEGKD